MADRNPCGWFVSVNRARYCLVVHIRYLLRTCSCLALGAGLVIPGRVVSAQETAPAARGVEQPEVSPELAPFEGRPVKGILIRRPPDENDVRPFDTATEQLVINQLRLREGAPFSSKLVSEDVARLNRLGKFRRVESRVQQLSDGSVEIVYILSQQQLIEDVMSVGNKRFSDEEIRAICGFLAQTPVDQVQLDRACRRIEAMYREKGYFNCRVVVNEKELKDSSIALFEIREGEKTRVTEIRFEGNLVFSSDELKSEIETKEAILFFKAPLENEKLDRDIAALIQFYRDRGHLDIRCDRIVTPSADGKEAIVTFIVEEGKPYTLRDLRISIDKSDDGVFTPAQLMALVSIKPGDLYSDDRIRKSMELVEAAYGKLGYADVSVVRREQRDAENPLVDVVLAINEGRRFRTGEVRISGNRETRDSVVRRAVTLLPDRPLDKTQVAETERRLRQTRLFATEPAPKVTVQPEDPANPGYRDVLIEVAETNTGEFSIGGTLGTDNGVAASLSVSQRNFDIYDVPTSWDELTGGGALRGGGQTFTLLASPGDRVSIFSIGLSDPSLFDTDFSGSAKGYFRRRVYRAYDEQRYGAAFSVGRRFGSRWSASVPVRFENVTLDNIDSDAPVDYFAQEDEQWLTGVGFTLSRQTLDDQFRPGRGSKLDFGVEQVLVGGDAFQKVDVESAGYFKLREDFYGRKTVLQLKSKLSYIPQDTTDVPFYEQYYMGGTNFRGFAYRGVSPVGVRNDNGQIGDDPVGGTFLFFAGAEVQHPVYEDLLSIVGFLDTGTVTDEPGFEEYRASVGFGFRLSVTALSPIPLAFDFGFPIKKEETDRTDIFSFSLDVPFR